MEKLINECENLITTEKIRSSVMIYCAYVSIFCGNYLHKIPKEYY